MKHALAAICQRPRFDKAICHGARHVLRLRTQTCVGPGQGTWPRPQGSKVRACVRACMRACVDNCFAPDAIPLVIGHLGHHLDITICTDIKHARMRARTHARTTDGRVCAYVSTYACRCAYVYVCLPMCACLCVRVCACVWMCVCLCARVYMRVSTCTCLRVRVYVRVYVYGHAHTRTNRRARAHTDTYIVSYDISDDYY